jgi:preprotein translocase subunit SecA
VDEFTGRLMVGRRYSEGLHQAIEAKEKVHVQEENQTLATITLQNFFRMYEKLAGMTGTAATEDSEFREIYKLPVMVVPTNMPMIRLDDPDMIYRTKDAKYEAVVEDIVARNAAGQPCLVGTISIENSELLARKLEKRGVPHRVLNAKYHEREAHIVSQAGRLGAVTIATNMAGRGTDIILGGNPEALVDDLLTERGIDAVTATEAQRDEALAVARETCKEEHEAVVEAGGLAVLGTERHEARRIDNQLRGRSGRQGDPGLSQFYLSLGDDLLRLFGGDRMDSIGNMMERTQIPDDVPIQAGLVSKAIESAQRQVELQNFSARKYLLEYDDVMNKQRQVIYAERNAILDGKDIHDRVEKMIDDTITTGVLEFCAERTYAEEWDWDGLIAWFLDLTGLTVTREEFKAVENPHEVATELAERAHGAYNAKGEQLGEENLGGLERFVMLSVIDSMWMDHLSEMDYLKDGIGLRAMGQRDPLVEYKTEAYEMFEGLVGAINESFLRTIMHVQVQFEEPALQQPSRAFSYTAPSEADIFSGGAMEAVAVGAEASEFSAASEMMAAGAESSRAAGGGHTFVKDTSDPYATVGRNGPCPCGSGKKYKKCHGAAAQ